MFRFVRALSALLLILCAAFGAQASIWFGDERGLHRLDPSLSIVDMNLAAGEAIAVVTDRDDESVWSISRSRILRYSIDGELVFSRSFASYPGNFGNARKVAINPADATAWVVGERRVLHINGGGGELLSVVPGEATDLAVAQDGTLWVLDEDGDELRRYTSGGALLQRINLGGASRRAHHLALDSLRGFVWLVADRALVKRSFKSPTQVLAQIDVAHDADAVCTDVETGDLWVLGDNTLHGYRPDGTSFASRNLGAQGIANARSLACDHSTRSVWVGHRRGISQFSRDGVRLSTLQARDSDSVAVTREAMPVRPELFPTFEDVGTYTDARPLFTFRAGATCAVSDCEFDPQVFGAYSYAAKLDGVEVGSLFVFDPNTGDVSFQPAAPLADGPHTLTAQAVDGSGNKSELFTFAFGVDATPPVLNSLTPPSGTRFPLFTQQILVDATFDTSATAVWINSAPPRPGNRYVQGFPVTGASLAFTLHAVDAFGNVASVPVVYTIEQPNRLPIVHLLQPTTGQVFDAPADITLEATATDSDGTIDRVMFVLGDFGSIIVTSPPYRAVFTGVPIGRYRAVAVAFDNKGDFNASGADVTVVGPPKVVVTTPAPGAAVFEGTLVTATFEPAPNRTIQSVTFLRDGQAYFTVPNPGTTYSINVSGSGVHTYGFVATDSSGAQGTGEITLTVKPFDLVVETPVANAEVTTGEVRVSGIYFGPTDTVIRVNGIPAFVTPTSPDGGTFTRPITLGTGPRVIEVELTSPSLPIGRGFSIPVTVLPIVIVPPPPPPPVGGGAG